MANTHSFIFEPGSWIGEGMVTFSASPDQLAFVTQWEIHSAEAEGIECSQEVRMAGIEDAVQNQFNITELTPQAFKITLKNDMVGEVQGTGLIDDKNVSWEFRELTVFQGFEVYEKEGDGVYKFHAEYASPDQFRTVIDGYIKKIDES